MVVTASFDGGTTPVAKRSQQRPRGRQADICRHVSSPLLIAESRGARSRPGSGRSASVHHAQSAPRSNPGPRPPVDSTRRTVHARARRKPVLRDDVTGDTRVTATPGGPESVVVLQEASLRWSRVDGDAVAEPRRYLTRVLTRLALDELRARQAKRESYVGEWLPEPVATGPPAVRGDRHLRPLPRAAARDGAPHAAAAGGVRAPDGVRAALRRDASIIERSTDDCRQLFRRAERALADQKPRFEPSEQEQRGLLREFVAAAREGDLPRRPGHCPPAGRPHPGRLPDVHARRHRGHSPAGGPHGRGRALGLVCWVGMIWATRRGKAWIRRTATVLFALGTLVALTALLVQDTSGDTGLAPLLGWIGVLPCVPACSPSRCCGDGPDPGHGQRQVRLVACPTDSRPLSPTRKSLKEVRTTVSDRGRGVRSRGERLPTRGTPNHGR